MTTTDSKVVMITGASKGMGEGIAKAFSKQEVRLSLSDIDDENFDNLVQECKDLGAKEVLKIVTDLSKNENMEMIMKETVEKFGRLDVLINNAGMLCTGNVQTIDLEKFDATFNIHVRTPLYLTQLAVPHLEKTKGNIINISSTGSKIIVPFICGYCITKCALDQLTKLSALELAEKGIRVNSVNPTLTRTPMLEQLAKLSSLENDEFVQQSAQQIPLKRILEVQEVADVILFLVSDKAQMITGTNLLIDGGYCLSA